ncbi:MAG: hypothetical protein IPM88_20840, partial [Nitrospira sp.]|nr:hypothetical protein [Nitrospira sp.]
MGGMLIASNQLNVSFTAFLSRFDEAVALRHMLIGLGKALLYGHHRAGRLLSGVPDSRRGGWDVGRHTTIRCKVFSRHHLRCDLQHFAQLVGP